MALPLSTACPKQRTANRNYVASSIGLGLASEFLMQRPFMARGQIPFAPEHRSGEKSNGRLHEHEMHCHTGEGRGGGGGAH